MMAGSIQGGGAGMRAMPGHVPAGRLPALALMLVLALGCWPDGWPAARSAEPAAQAAVRPGTALELGLDEAVRRALEVGQEARIAAAQAKEAQTQRGAALANVLPSLEGSGSYSRNLKPIQLTLPGGLGSIPGLPIGQENTHSYSLTLSQPLWRPGSLRGVRIAEDYFQISKDQETETRLDLVLRLCDAYYGAVLSIRLAEIVQIQIDQLEDQLRSIRLQRQAGNASDLDVSRIEINRENVQPQLVDAYNSRDAALLFLRRLINVPPETEVVLTDVLNSDHFVPVPEGELAVLIEKGIRQRASVRAAERMVRVRRAEVKQAKAAYLPSLDAYARIGEQAYPKDFFPSSKDFQDDWSVGLQLRVPIFEGGRRRAGVRAAEFRGEQAALQLELLLENLRRETAEARLRLKRAAELIESRVRATAIARRAYELTDLAYRQGDASHLELTEARSNLRQARANEVQAVHAYYTSYLGLLRSVGVRPEDFSQAKTLTGHKRLVEALRAPEGKENQR